MPLDDRVRRGRRQRGCRDRGNVRDARSSNSLLPAAYGDDVQDETLSAFTGNWSNAPTSYAYQWQDCATDGTPCTPIAGATSATYTLTGAGGDVGHTIRVEVTATNAAGASTAATSDATGVVQALTLPVNESVPSLSGTAKQGDTLTESNGYWTEDPTGYGYQWEDCDSSGASCTPIAGATGQTYVIGAGDVGHRIVVLETAYNKIGFAAKAAASDPTAVVKAAAPTSTGVPTITGATIVGQTLTESHANWTNSPTSYAYEWEDCNSSGTGCVTIAGAIDQTYQLAASDLGHTIRVLESASNPGGTSAAATSAPTSVVQSALVVAPPPTDTAAPSISGTAARGRR